jgi:hypothetical protein
MARTPDSGADALSVIVISLNTMAGVAQLSVPYVQPLILLASAIICGIQVRKILSKISRYYFLILLLATQREQEGLQTART